MRAPENMTCAINRRVSSTTSCPGLLVLRTIDLAFDLPDDSLVHYVVNVSSTLTENVVCSGLEYTNNKVTSARFKPSLGDGELER